MHGLVWRHICTVSIFCLHNGKWNILLPTEINDNNLVICTILALADHKDINTDPCLYTPNSKEQSLCYYLRLDEDSKGNTNLGQWKSDSQS